MKKVIWLLIFLSGCKSIPVEHRVKVLYNGGKPFVTYEMRLRDEIPKNYD